MSFNFTSFTINHFINQINNDQKFSISRWGNGEFDSLLNRKTVQYRNSSKHNYFPEIGTKLDQILKSNPKYYIAIANRFFRNEKFKFYYDLLIDYYDKNNLNIDFIDCDVFYLASKNNQLKDFIDTINNKPILVVGPSHFKNLNKTLKSIEHHIESPLINCWLSYDKILEKTISYLDKNKNKSYFVSISFSLSAGILVDDLYNKYKNHHWFIDIGSLWDPYCGVISRQYHKNLEIIKNETTKN